MQTNNNESTENFAPDKKLAVYTLAQTCLGNMALIKRAWNENYLKLVGLPNIIIAIFFC